MKNFLRCLLVVICISWGYGSVAASNQVSVDACWSVTSEMFTSTTTMFSTSNETPALQEQIEDRIECLPNPTTHQTLLRWDTDIDRIEVISESGQRVRTYNVSGLTQKTIDMSHMSAGVYFVRFWGDGSVVVVKKLIKR